MLGGARSLTRPSCPRLLARSAPAGMQSQTLHRRAEPRAAARVPSAGISAVGEGSGNQH